MKNSIALLTINLLLVQLTIAQVANFDLKSFVTAGFDAWSLALGNTQSSYLRCMELCRGTGFHQRPMPTLPPFFSRVNWSFKTTVNCINEIRGLRQMCNSMLRNQDLIQIGGNQYIFLLDIKLKYHKALKYCKSRNMDLVSLARSPKLDSHLIATYLKNYASQSAENKAAVSVNLTFWELKTDVTDKSNVMLCPSFSYANVTDLAVVNASRVQEQCSNANMFVCEVPNLCYKDICRGNVISKYKAVAPPTTVPGASVTTAKAGATVGTTPTPFMCEQCHLNHTLLYAKACPAIACPTCWGIEPPDIPGKGKDLHECNGKSYFYLDSKGSHGSAMSKCCALGMRSVSIATDDDSECIKEYLNMLIDRRDMDEGRQIWTSATNMGNNCQGRFTWCNGGTNGAVNALTRLNFDQTTQAGSDDCVAMMTRTVGTEMVLTVAGKPCIMPLPVICEAPAPANSKFKNSVLSKRGGNCEGRISSCPRADTTPMPRTVYGNENSRFIDGAKRHAPICDKQYYVEAGPVAKFDILGRFCLDKRAEVGFVESFEELNCIRDRYIATAAKDPLLLDKMATVAWLKGSDQNCPGSGDGPSWCNNGATISSYLMKGGSQGSRCIAIDMKSSKFNIVSVSCERSQEYYICKETCTFPTCPKVSCVVSKKGDPKEKKICGGLYLVVEEKKTMVEAMEYCCQLGMSLLSMETAAETECIGKWLKDSLSGVLPVWTSGTDHNCKGRYAWCSTGEMFAREAFNQFFIPSTGDDDSNLDHHCVSAVFLKDFPLRHQQCDNKFNFICEKIGKFGRTEMWPQSPSLYKIFNTTYL